MVSEMSDPVQWLDALHLASPALPIGGFAYSQGLEQAHALAQVIDKASAATWIEDHLLLVLARQELPWWLACYEAASACDWPLLQRHVQTLMALRETAEFRLESKQMAYSLVRLFDQWLPLEDRPPEDVVQAVSGNLTAAHATLCASRRLDKVPALTAYLWAWLENQVLAAVKIIPLGQLDGQALMHGLKPCVAQAIEQARHTALCQAASAPIGLAIMSAFHETQYTRLFRS
jgi:urease accessory protein